MACIDGSAPEDTVEIATNGPIEESISITKNLSLVASAGVEPVFAVNRNILASSPNSDRAFWIEGLTLAGGAITVQNLVAGSLIATVRNNHCRSIRIASTPNADLIFHVTDNELAPAFGDLAAIAVVAEDAFGDGEIARNRIAMPSTNDALGISVEAEFGSMDVDVDANRVTGSLYDGGIRLSQTGPAPFSARVANNLVTGATALGDGIYASGQGGDGATDVTIVNNTVVENSHGVIVIALDAVIANNVVAGSDSIGFAICPTGGSTVVDRNNLVFDNVDDFFSCDPGSDTIFADPLFGDAVDFRPIGSSPVVNAGDDSLVPLGITTDLDGNPRKIGTVDIGAYEVPEPGAALVSIAALLTLAVQRVVRPRRV